MEYKSGLRALLAFAVAACAFPAHAQDVSRCKIDGKTVYQQAPCPGADLKVRQVVVTAAKPDPAIGMRIWEVEGSSWGTPMYKNTQTTANAFTEQWVYYGHKYIYLRNGVVTAIQQ